MRSPLRFLALICSASFAVGLAAAQTPTLPAGAPQGTRPPRPAPTNIKALPKDITGDQIGALMQHYEADLGVGCSFCHAPRDPETRRSNFASDANPKKDVSRTMITMTAEINSKYLASISNRTSTEPVTCATCHQGHSIPPAFVPPPRTPPTPGSMPGMPGMGTPMAPKPPAQ
jgi:hypothetical protein